MNGGPRKTIGLQDNITNPGCAQPVAKMNPTRGGLTRSQLEDLINFAQQDLDHQGCALIRDVLHVNDFLAEWCLRHIKSEVAQDDNFTKNALVLYDETTTRKPDKIRFFINRVFGIHGPAANSMQAKF
jgi:hypothetical protein